MKIILTLLSITGVYLNTKKKRICFIIWIFTNSLWAAVDFSHSLWEQGALFIVYVGLAVYGWFNWKPKASIWHGPEEEPDADKYIIYEYFKGCYFIRRVHSVGEWEKLKKDKSLIRWAYTKDLPK